MLTNAKISYTNFEDSLMKTIKNTAFFPLLATFVFFCACEQKNEPVQSPKSPLRAAEEPQSTSDASQTVPLPAADDYFAWGNRYYYGLGGTKQDYQKSFEFFNKAYQNEEDCANIALGNMYYDGHGVEKDIKKALKLWAEGDECSTRDGNNDYSFEAYNNLLNYIIEHKDKDLAFSLGDSCFERFGYKTIRCGHASTLDDDDRYPCEQGEKWYKLAAEYGHPEAMVRLADNYLIYANIHHNCYSYFNGDWGDTEKEYYHRHEGERLLLSAATQGYVDAWEELGDMYFYGHLPMDHKKAEKWYLKAASKGKGHSAMMLARLYLGGKDSGVPADYQKSYYWANQAIARGVKEAKYYLGMLYYDGKGIDKDRNKALKLFKEVPDDGEFESLLAGIMLQNMYINGECTAKDYESLAKEKGRCYYYYCTKGWLFGKDNYSNAEERVLWQAAFEVNDILAQIHLMQKYEKEAKDQETKNSALILRTLVVLHSEPKDEFARKEWKKAKEFIEMEQSKIDGIKDYEHASDDELIKAATLKNDTKAQRQLGAKYILKSKDAGDYSKEEEILTPATEWYILAARLGDNIAQAQLASMYNQDKTGMYRKFYDPNTIPQEVYWLEKAVAQKNPTAEYALANRYYKGVMFTDEQGAIYSQSFRELFMVRDFKKAFNLYKKSAEAGYVPAMKKLAYMYEHGEYVEPDYLEYSYWKKQAEKGESDKSLDEKVNFYNTEEYANRI